MGRLDRIDSIVGGEQDRRIFDAARYTKSLLPPDSASARRRPKFLRQVKAPRDRVRKRLIR